MSFLPYWPIGFITSSFKLLQPIYLTFTSSCAHGPMAIIPVMLVHWVYYLFSWVLAAYLLYFYQLLCPWACWMSWSIGFITSFLGNSWLIYFTFNSSTSLFLSHSPIVGLLLPLGFLSKNGHQHSTHKHVDCSCNSYVNTFAVFFRGHF